MDLIDKYFPELTEKQRSQFIYLKELYEDWNTKINVISRKDIGYLYERHILHSLAIAKVISFRDNTSIMDVGTGGGFPGIPLAIAFPGADFFLVDSIAKKTKVVYEVAKALGLENVTTEQNRVEKITKKYDFIISRAVTSFPVFYNWVKKNIKKDSANKLNNGILYLKGGKLDEELKNFKLKIKIYNISDYFTESFFETKKIIYLPV